jgi:septal ring factor EnvC (AmiA/AmiB activator)
MRSLAAAYAENPLARRLLCQSALIVAPRRRYPGGTCVASLDKRVATLESAVVEHSRTIDGIRDAIVSLERRLDCRFADIDRRFAEIDRRLETIDRRFEAIDRRFEAMDDRLFALDMKASRQFMWVVGIQMTTLAAIVAALVAR